MRILESHRMILRPWNISDLNDLHEIMSNKDVAALAGFNIRISKEDTLNTLKQFIVDSSASLWAIELKSTNKAIGWIELHKYNERTDKNSREIGCVLSQEYWGQGLMEEAFKEVLNYGFNEEKLDSIVCSHSINNTQSKRLIEKCHFKYVKKNNAKIYYCLNKNDKEDFKIVKIYFKELQEEIDTLIEFLTSDTWEFFGTPNLKLENIRKSYEANHYTGDDCRTFWVILNQDTKVGMIRIYDLQNGDPLFDIRILSKYKGIGIGTITVNWIADYIFNNFPDKKRIEANTRQDNYAMRCVFHKCNFVKEAHHRKAWVGLDGKAYDSIGYGITKEDWQSGNTTPVNWNDFKY